MGRCHRIKSWSRVGAWTGTLKNPTKCLWRWEPDGRSNFFFSPPAHLCTVTYMTEISLIVTLNNQFNSTHFISPSFWRGDMKHNEIHGDTEDLFSFYIPGSPRESCGRKEVRLGYCSTPYQRLWLYNGAPLVAFYDTLGIRRTYSRLKPPAPSRGQKRSKMPQSINGQDGNLGFPISPKNKTHKLGTGRRDLGPGVQVENASSVSPACRKRQLIGRFLELTVQKGRPRAGAWTGTFKNPTEYLASGTRP